MGCSAAVGWDLGEVDVGTCDFTLLDGDCIRRNMTPNAAARGPKWRRQ